MPRTVVYSALVLRSRHCGENREVWLLTAEAGIIRATVFGGPKSRLRSHAAPFHSGQVWAYCDPVKDTRKITDFDVQSWRPGIRELYERTMAGDAVAETILAAHGGGGNWAASLHLAEEVLDVIENSNEELCSLALVYFLWSWAGLLGVQPQLERCAACGGEAAAGLLWYSTGEGGALCGNCAGGEKEGLLPLNPGCRRWFEAVRTLEPSQVSSYTMDKKSFSEAKALTCAILAEILGKRLASWDW
ncbi:MAG: DNA repair protein RecO [Treponema sp.]|nr:DNA repair protein RecO [Treponema sp.]